GIHPYGQYGALGDHAPAFADLELQGIHDHKRVRYRLQRTLVPFPDDGVQGFAQLGHRRLGEACPTQLFGDTTHLPGRYPVDHHLHHCQKELSHTLVSTKKLVQYLAIYGNLVLGHPLQPPVGFVDQLNHYQEGDGPSYCYAILILEFTPSYRTLLLVWSTQPIPGGGWPFLVARPPCRFYTVYWTLLSR